MMDLGALEMRESCLGKDLKDLGRLKLSLAERKASEEGSRPENEGGFLTVRSVTGAG